MGFFDISNVFFSVKGYPVSYLEFFGLLSGVIAISLSSVANIWNWPIGVINVVLSFFLFYQVQLYPDMFLQVFFLFTNMIGWWRWLHPKSGEEDRKKQLRVSFLDSRGKLTLFLLGVAGTFVVGEFAQNLHEVAPALFHKPSAYPFLDSFIMVMSIVTTFYVIEKKIESWIVWIVVDAIATWLYFQRDLLLYSLLYLLFCFIAAFGLFNWIKQYNSHKANFMHEP
jgi:nicotinamide mononucleotide transporter